jgi:hypothetical protein
MTAESLVLAYWGYGTDYNPNNLSQEQQNELKNTVLLMHEWENIKMKKVKADAAAMEILNTAQEREIDKLKREVIGMDEEIRRIVKEFEDNTDLEKEIDRLKVELYYLSKHNSAIIIDLNEQRAQLRERDECIEKLSALLLIYETADAESGLETSILGYDEMKQYVTLKKEIVGILLNNEQEDNRSVASKAK